MDSTLVWLSVLPMYLELHESGQGKCDAKGQFERRVFSQRGEDPRGLSPLLQSQLLNEIDAVPGGDLRSSQHMTWGSQ